MSFLSVLEKIGSVAGSVATVLIPGLGLSPKVAAIATTVAGSIVKVEQTAATLANPPSGQDKKTTVINDVNAGLALTSSILADYGITFDVNAPALQAAIGELNDAQVAVFNAYAKVKAAIDAAHAAVAPATPVVPAVAKP